MVKNTVELLDKNLNVLTEVKALKPFDKSGTILQFSKELSNYGQCKFRISAYDTMFDTYGDIIKPHANHVRIRKGSKVIWQGAIVDNPHRNRNYIDVLAYEYEFYLSKVLVTRSSADPNGTGQTDVYRTFNSGTMASAVTTIMNETIAKFQSNNHILASMTLGTVENPNYPPNMVSAYQTATQTFPLTGGWTFGQETNTSLGPTLIFDYHSIQYIIKSFGIYAYADHQIIPTSNGTGLIFNFKGFIGNNRQSNLVFSYGDQGNIIDYELPRLGQRMANSIYGIATDTNGTILHVNPSDQSSVQTNGLMEDTAAFADVKSQGVLQQRTAATLALVATPDESNAIIYLNEKGYPLGQYDIGDIVTFQVVNKGVNFNQVRRIVGITVLEDNTGRERTALQTNQPLPWQLPSV